MKPNTKNDIAYLLVNKKPRAPFQTDIALMPRANNEKSLSVISNGDPSTSVSVDCTKNPANAFREKEPDEERRVLKLVPVSFPYNTRRASKAAEEVVIADALGMDMDIDNRDEPQKSAPNNPNAIIDVRNFYYRDQADLAQFHGDQEPARQSTEERIPIHPPYTDPAKEEKQTLTAVAALLMLAKKVENSAESIDKIEEDRVSNSKIALKENSSQENLKELPSDDTLMKEKSGLSGIDWDYKSKLRNPKKQTKKVELAKNVKEKYKKTTKSASLIGIKKRSKKGIKKVIKRRGSKFWDSKRQAYICLLCGKTFAFPQNRRRHWREKHPDENCVFLKCRFCDKTFAKHRHKDYQGHLNTHSENQDRKPFYCGCGREFNGERQLRNHRSQCAIKKRTGAEV